MARIAAKKIKFTVEVTIGCSEPESFKKSEDFWSQDGNDMIPYLSDKIHDSLDNEWQYAAKVNKVFVKVQK